MSNSWVTHLIDAEDGSGDLILQFPDELIAEKGWKEGTVLNLKVEETPTGNIIIVTEKE
jgi:hypothetical protein